MTGEEFLQSKDIWNHPMLVDRNMVKDYIVAELLEEYLEIHKKAIIEEAKGRIHKRGKHDKS